MTPIGAGPRSGRRRIRPPAVAGTFYPARPEELAATVDAELSRAASGVPVEAARPKGLIVPHAGYVYSGPVAATAYARLGPSASSIERVVLAGPAHRAPVRGIGLSSADAWLTPLGTVVVDEEARRHLARRTGVEMADRAHAPEHSLEVQVPFLQRALGDDWTLVPLIVGDAPADLVADTLDAVWGGPETLIVVSSDLSHYHPYDRAVALDRATAEAIVAGQPVTPNQACGARPVDGLLISARRHGLTTELVDLRNSADTAGDRDRVVGYGAFVLPARVPVASEP